MKESMFLLNNLKDTQAFATNLAKVTRIGDTVTLSGDLGVGKTSFAQFFIKSLTSEETEVTSPTFNIVNIYQINEAYSDSLRNNSKEELIKNLSIWHFDLYRLQSKDEIYELGIEEAWDTAISLIEWPDIIHNILPKDRIEIELSFLDDDDKRKMIIRTFGSCEKMNYLKLEDEKSGSN